MTEPLADTSVAALELAKSELANAVTQIARRMHEHLDTTARHAAESAEKFLNDDAENATEFLGNGVHSDIRTATPAASSRKPTEITDYSQLFNERRVACEAMDNTAKEIFGHTTRMVRYDTPDGPIWLSAQRHTKDPKDGQYPLIRRGFEKFVAESTGCPRVALNEAYDVTDREVHLLAPDLTIKKGGEVRHIKMLAVRHGIPGIRGDIRLDPDEFVITDTRREREHLLYGFLNKTRHLHRDGHSGDAVVSNLREWIPKVEERLRSTGEWPHEGGPQELKYEDYLTWHKKYLRKPFDPGNDLEEILNPNHIYSKNPITRLNTYRSNKREMAILEEIVGRNKQGIHVFGGYGASHVTLWQPILDELYGEPMIYRYGQMSGKLLMGSVDLTSADIRGGIATVQQRIEETDDAIKKQLWQEELHTLQRELSGRS